MYMHVWIVCLWTIEFREVMYVYKWIIYGVQSVYYKDVKSEMRSRDSSTCNSIKHIWKKVMKQDSDGDKAR